MPKDSRDREEGFCPNVRVITRIKIELAYYDYVSQCFNQYTTRTYPKEMDI